MGKTTSLLCNHRRSVLCLLALLGTPSALAETITIGKGSGIVWEGLPFNVALSGPTYTDSQRDHAPLLAIGNQLGLCMKSSTLTTIQGYQALELTPGVGLIPKATAKATYRRYADYTWGTLTGTIGLPETKGNGTYGQINPPKNSTWCLPPTYFESDKFYAEYSARTAKFTGTWVLVADGTQKFKEITLPEMYAGSYVPKSAGTLSQSIIPSDTILRISTLECTVNTPTSIAFGSVAKDTQAGAEIGILSYPLITTCGQKSDLIDANISLQFRPLSGLYNNAPTRLALKEGGGYITGEINNSVTGSGSCTATTGLPFDNTGLKVGNITKAQTSSTFTHQVTWRLCSGGQNLPLGDVNAAAEMLVTFN